MSTDQLLKLVLTTLDDSKGYNIKAIDVQDKTSVTDYMVFATGTSERHVKALADHVVEKVKEHHFKPLGVEGGQASDWILVDLGDVIVHVMLAQTREFYQLEKLWGAEYKEARA